MLFHLGPPGRLFPLPVIETDAEPDESGAAPGGLFVSLKGAKSQDRIGPHRRSWGLEWKYLTLEDFDLLDALRRGHMGGPLRLLDPNLPNKANAQIATGGTEERSVLGWQTLTGARRFVLPTSLPTDLRADGAIEWTKQGAADDLTTGREVEAYRVPISPDGRPVTVATRIRRTDAATGSPVSPGFDCFDRTGALTTTVVAAASSSVTGTWADLAFTLAPPAGTCEVAPMWRSPVGQAGFHLAGVRVGYGPTAPKPSRGGGAPQVVITGLPQTYPSLGEFSFSVSIDEA